MDGREIYREALRLELKGRSVREIADLLKIPLRQAENVLKVSRALGEEALREKVRRPRKDK